jgi:hypothetical protein
MDLSIPADVTTADGVRERIPAFGPPGIRDQPAFQHDMVDAANGKRRADSEPREIAQRLFRKLAPRVHACTQ